MPRPPLVAKEPKELTFYLFRSGTNKLTEFEFLPNQSFRLFWFLFREKLPQQHARIHWCFCHIDDCPFHR
jgi:hypothetical protein